MPLMNRVMNERNENMGGVILVFAGVYLFVNHPILTTIAVASLMTGLKSRD